MTGTRLALPAVLLLATGCVSVPSGIVDDFTPPQAQTVVAEIKTPLCEDTGKRDGATDAKTPTPCMTEIVTLATTRRPLAPGAFERNRPRPPLIRRR